MVSVGVFMRTSAGDRPWRGRSWTRNRPHTVRGHERRKSVRRPVGAASGTYGSGARTVSWPSYNYDAFKRII
jgi:hypothetical protein